MSKPSSRTNTYGGRSQEKKDKTNDGNLPTAPSPTQTSPDLTQSMSNTASNSSSSPPEPATPPPRMSRSRTRYPDLGRVPLHRRGTSNTYERLEDLLKEAGYKETRVFTPETERVAANADGEGRSRSADNRLSVMKDSVGAVVGFLAGLMPSVTGSRTNLPSSAAADAAESGNEPTMQYATSPQDYSPPASPLAQRRPPKSIYTRTSLDLSEPPTPNMTSSIDSLADQTRKANRQHLSGSSRPGLRATHSHTDPPYHQQQQHPPPVHRASSQLSYASNQMQKQPSRSSLNRQSQAPGAAPAGGGGGGIGTNQIASPRPSRAGAYLRHMASVPSMPPRPNSTPVHLMNRPKLLINDNDSEGGPGLTYNRRGNGEGEEEHEPQPPLPPTWLESVARAVLFGGTGAYIGGPSSSSANFLVAPDPPAAGHPSQSGKTQVLRSTRSSLSQASYQRKRSPLTARSGLSDQTNTTVASTSTILVPPPLFSKIERGRAGRSEGEVSMTRVVCRSAPGSRSGSTVRGHNGKEKRKPGHDQGGIWRRREEKDRVPSLARTRAEGDVWSRRKTSTLITHAPASAASDENRYLSGWGAEVESGEEGAGVGAGGPGGPSASCSEEDDDDEEEDEGELDLAKLLVPSKRQNSIKSLRKHLTASDASALGLDGARATLKSLSGETTPRSHAVAVAGRGMSVHTASSGLLTPNMLQRRATMEEEDWDRENDHNREEWGGGWVRRSNVGSRGSEEDDDVESFVGFFGEGRGEWVGTGSGRSRSAGKSRLGFNGAWGLMGGGGGGS